jgi:hypothetical protein
MIRHHVTFFIFPTNLPISGVIEHILTDHQAVYALKALIANLLTAKGLTQLRAGLRAHVKGLTIIINLICNILGSPLVSRSQTIIYSVSIEGGRDDNFIYSLILMAG